MWKGRRWWIVNANKFETWSLMEVLERKLHNAKRGMERKVLGIT